VTFRMIEEWSATRSDIDLEEVIEEMPS